MKTRLMTALICLGAVAHAENPAPAAAPAAPAESAPKYTREQMVEILGKQEALVEKLSDEFFAANEALEKKMEDVVSLAASFKDTQDTGTRVNRMKAQLVEGIGKSIRALRLERDKNRAELARLPSYRQDGSSQDRAAEFLDEKIEGRVDLLMDLANSMHRHRDVKKYRYYYEEDWDDDIEVKRKVTDEYKDNRMKSTGSRLTRDELTESIEKEEHRLKQRNNHLEAEMKRAPNLDHTAAKAEVADNQEFLDVLAEKKRELLTGSKATEGKGIGDMSDAMELERQIGNEIREMRGAANQLRILGQRLKGEINRLNAQQAALAAHDAKAGAGKAE